jgi:polysaccharide export outer membrane protein
MVALLAITAWPGCQSGPRPFADSLAKQSSTDSFAIRTGADHPPRRLWSGFQSNTTPTVIAASPAPATVMPAATAPVTPFSTVPAAAAQPAVLLQPVPRAAPPREPAIIASSWQPVQHLEPAVGPDLGVAPAQLDRRLVVETAPIGVARYPSTPSSPLRPTPAAPSQQIVSAEPQTAADADTIVLPQPRPVLPPSGGPLPPEAYGPHGGVVYDYGHHGPMAAPAVPKEFRKQALPSYVVEPPDILLIQSSAEVTKIEQVLQGSHLVRPDGTVNLGINGTVFVAGLTIEQVKDAIARQLWNNQTTKKFTEKQIKDELDVDVLVYNSKWYYIITDGGGYGAQVYRVPVTGNETVLDALAQINGLPAVASKKQIWVARATPGDFDHPKILPVDWCGLAERGSAATNYQIYPNDRIFVQSSPAIRVDTVLSKILSPVNRVFGSVLLGATTVNTIKSGSTSGTGGAVR